MAGRSSAGPVEFVDVYPTLVELCGLPPAPAVDGVSLRPLLADPSGSVKPVAISQYPRGKSHTGDVPLMGYSLRDERWRLTVWREDGTARVVATELYDEENDPAETVNLASRPESAAVIARLSQHLPPPGPAASRIMRNNRRAEAAAR